MNTICYAVAFIDKDSFRMKSIGLYSEGPGTLTYDYRHESGAELFRIERSSFQDAYNDAVIMLSMRFLWARSVMTKGLLDEVEDARAVRNEELGKHDEGEE